MVPEKPLHSQNDELNKPLGLHYTLYWCYHCYDYSRKYQCKMSLQDFFLTRWVTVLLTIAVGFLMVLD